MLRYSRLAIAFVTKWERAISGASMLGRTWSKQAYGTGTPYIANTIDRSITSIFTSKCISTLAFFCSTLSQTHAPPLFPLPCFFSPLPPPSPPPVPSSCNPSLHQIFYCCTPFTFDRHMLLSTRMCSRSRLRKMSSELARKTA